MKCLNVCVVLLQQIVAKNFLNSPITYIQTT